MSSVNYNLKNKGVRLISSDDAWIKGKNGKQRLNPKYNFVGKIDTKLPNMIITASDKKKEKAEVKTSAQRSKSSAVRVGQSRRKQSFD